jgi:hypothetical protein
MRCMHHVDGGLCDYLLFPPTEKGCGYIGLSLEEQILSLGVYLMIAG